MKDATNLTQVRDSAELFTSQRDIEDHITTRAVDMIDHCVKMLDKNKDLCMNDEVVNGLMYKELLGALLRSRQVIEELENM